MSRASSVTRQYAIAVRVLRRLPSDACWSLWALHDAIREYLPEWRWLAADAAFHRRLTDAESARIQLGRALEQLTAGGAL